MTAENQSQSALSVSSRRLADCRLVSVGGSIDHTNFEDFSERLADEGREVPAGGGMVIDLAGVELITSAGLRSLLTARRTVGAAGGTLVVCGLRGVVEEVFRIARYHDLLPVADTTEQALGQVSAAAAEAWSG